MGMVLPVSNSATSAEEAGDGFKLKTQADLHSGFQASRDYIVETSLKNKHINKQTKTEQEQDAEDLHVHICFNN